MQERHAATAVVPRGGEVTRSDVKMVIRSAALFVAPLETALRQIEPAITLGQLAALDIIVHAGSVRPYRLGELMSVSRQLAWQSCKRLEGLGLVAMAEREGQNGVVVSATDAGVAHTQSVAAIYDRLAERLSQDRRVLDVSPAKTALTALASAAASLCQAERSGRPQPDGGRGSRAETLRASAADA